MSYDMSIVMENYALIIERSGFPSLRRESTESVARHAK